MKQIDIEIPNPLAAIITIVAVVLAVITVDRLTDPPLRADARGGESKEEQVHDAEKDAVHLRQQQAVLKKREEILRYQLDMLRAERERRGNDLSPTLADDIEKSEEMLLNLLRDQQESEAKILISLKQIWDAESLGSFISQKAGTTNHAKISLIWPVQPTLGISAGFDDPNYFALFGMEHKADDIPTDQGTVVRAAAEGYVDTVSDNGYGYNSITLRHDGYATLYGHVESFLVEEGQRVRQGQAIALSGGRPGTKGAGHLTTGEHLHFELIINGERVDPLPHLPPLDL